MSVGKKIGSFDCFLSATNSLNCECLERVHDSCGEASTYFLLRSVEEPELASKAVGAGLALVLRVDSLRDMGEGISCIVLRREGEKPISFPT